MGDCEVVIETGDHDDYMSKSKIKMRKRKSGRKTSEMWNYFTPLDEFLATCNLCGLQFSYRTSTTNLKKHVVSKHFGGKRKNGENGPNKHESESDDRREENSSPERLIEFKERESQNKHSLNESVGVKRQFVEVPCESHPSHCFWRSDDRRESDEYDAYAFTIAAKLRKMEEKQRLYAERVINDALFKGALDQLSPLSEIVICIASSTPGS